jgi:hypothetical protein
VGFDVEIKYGSLYPNNNIMVKSTFDSNEHTPKLLLVGGNKIPTTLSNYSCLGASVEISIKPAVTFHALSILEAQALLEPYLRSEMMSQFPPFKAISSGNYKNSLVNYGSCKDSHYLRYEILGGIRARVKGTVNFLNNYNINYPVELVDPISIVSGCLLQQNKPPVQLTLSFATTLSQLDMSASTFMHFLVEDITNVMSGLSFVQIQGLELTEVGNKLEVEFSFVEVKGVSGKAQDIAQRFQQLVEDQNSALYDEKSRKVCKLIHSIVDIDCVVGFLFPGIKFCRRTNSCIH